MWEVFFALHCGVLAWLIFRSRFRPRVLGPLMGLAGLGYLANGLGNVVLPELSGICAVLVCVGAVVGAVPFVLWLAVKGVDAQA